MFAWIVVPKNIVAKTNVQGTKKFTFKSAYKTQSFASFTK
jgi:hypothetical protein